MIARQLTISSGSNEVIAKTGYGDPVRVQNLGTGILWIGGLITVDETDGFKVPVNGEIDLRHWSGNICGYAETADCDVRIIEEKLG